MNWNITTGTNACQTHTHTKKHLYITHAHSCAFLLSLSFCRNTNTVGVFLACLKSWPLSQTLNRISVTAAAKQFRPLDVCWYRFHTTNIAHLCLNVYVQVARKHPRTKTQTHTQRFVRASHKRQLMASMWKESKYVCVCGKGLFVCSLTVYHSGGFLGRGQISGTVVGFLLNDTKQQQKREKKKPETRQKLWYIHKTSQGESKRPWCKRNLWLKLEKAKHLLYLFFLMTWKKDKWSIHNQFLKRNRIQLVNVTSKSQTQI